MLTEAQVQALEKARTQRQSDPDEIETRHPGCLEDLQADLDDWMLYYNQRRTHQGKCCQRRTPMQAFVAAAGPIFSNLLTHDHLTITNPAVKLSCVYSGKCASVQTGDSDRYRIQQIA